MCYLCSKDDNRYCHKQSVQMLFHVKSDFTDEAKSMVKIWQISVNMQINLMAKKSLIKSICAISIDTVRAL